MERTGHYYETLAYELTEVGFFVSAVNLEIICGFQDDDKPLRNVKSAKADFLKLARFTLNKWINLKQFGLMDELHSQLKTMNHSLIFL